MGGRFQPSKHADDLRRAWPDPVANLTRRRSHRPKLSWDCADLLTTNPLPGRRSSGMVGTITRSAQSALPRLLPSSPPLRPRMSCTDFGELWSAFIGCWGCDVPRTAGLALDPGGGGMTVASTLDPPARNGSSLREIVKSEPLFAVGRADRVGGGSSPARRAGLRPGLVEQTSRRVRHRCRCRRSLWSGAPCPACGVAARRRCRPASACRRCW